MTKWLMKLPSGAYEMDLPSADVEARIQHLFEFWKQILNFESIYNARGTALGKGHRFGAILNR